MALITEAITTSTPQGGYNVERFIDKSAFLEECICSICSNILRNPLVTPCEHLFCTECIQKWLAKGPGFSTCPIDRRQFEASQLMKPARVFFNLYNKLELKCKNNSDGCKEIVFVEDVTAHEETCLYRYVYCSNEGCNVLDQVNKLNTHESTNCMHRLQKCKQCQATLKWRDMDIHREILCPETQVVCDCGKSRPRHLFENHRDNECPNTIIDCPTIGCIEHLRRKNMVTHLAKPEHIMLLYNEVTNIGSRMDTIGKFMGEMKESLDQIKRDIKKNKCEAMTRNDLKCVLTQPISHTRINKELSSSTPTRHFVKDVSLLKGNRTQKKW